MRIGDIEVLPLSDGLFWLDGGAMFGVVPKTLWSRKVTADEKNRIPLGLRPMLIRTGGRTVLVDAGIGDKLAPKEMQIYGVDRSAETLDRSLAAVGCTARDIDIVLASHLHFDHAGGFTSLVDGVLGPRFPRARYWIRRGEWEDAIHPNERNRASYLAENLAPLEAAQVIDFIEGDGEILPGVSVWRTGGHTMHHQIIKVSGGGRTVVFAADLLPTTAHIDGPWVMGYDLYPLETLDYKRTFVPEAIREEYVIFFEHDPKIAAGIIREEAGRRWVDPVAL